MTHLVILAPNWLGDAVMALPAIADVRRGAPDATIVVAARPAIAPLFMLVPDVNDVLVLEPPASIPNMAMWRALGVELAARKFDTALVLPNSVRSALLASRAGIPNRWGYRTGWRGGLFTRAIDRAPGLHQVVHYQHLVHALGFPNGPVEPRVTVSAAMRAAGGRLLIESGWDGQTPIVALAPGAAYGGAKRWPERSFAELIDAFAADGVRSVLIGSGGDAATGDKVLAAAARRTACINAIGRTDLPTLAGVMTHCRALVTNDSGAMHLGAAAGVPVTAVFGPTDEHATRPLGDAHAVLTHPVWCRPCMLRECPIDHRCMSGVGVAAVLDAARRTL